MNLAPNKNIFISMSSVGTKEKYIAIWFHILQPVIWWFLVFFFNHNINTVMLQQQQPSLLFLPRVSKLTFNFLPQAFSKVEHPSTSYTYSSIHQQ